MTTIGHTDNAVIIAATLNLVWRDTNDVRTWPALFSEYASVEVLDERADYVRFRLTMHPDDTGTAWSWVSERELVPERHTVHARRVEPGPFEHMTIRWDYCEVPGGVEMRWRQDFRMRSTAPVTDEEMTCRINANSQREMLRIKHTLEQRYAVTLGARS